MPALSETGSLAALERLQPGRWEIRARGTSGPGRQICLRDGRDIIQLRHPGTGCEHYVVDDQALAATVQYTCRGRGYGRTHVHVESPILAQVEAQGIAEGFPFNFVAEARRVGSCN